MAAFGRGPQPARPGPAWRPATRPPVTRMPLEGLGPNPVPPTCEIAGIK